MLFAMCPLLPSLISLLIWSSLASGLINHDFLFLCLWHIYIPMILTDGDSGTSNRRVMDMSTFDQFPIYQPMEAILSRGLDIPILPSKRN